MRVSVETPAPLSGSSGFGEDEVWDLVGQERGSLSRLKQVSVRRGTWFAVLSWQQRRFIDLVMQTVDRIRSGLLLKALAPLVRKLLISIGGDTRRGALRLMDRGAYKMMMGVAEKIVQTAQRLGNSSACEWLNGAFINYLLVMNLPENGNSVTLAPW